MTMLALETHKRDDQCASTYARLLYWAIWATGRREINERNDVLSAGINYSELTQERIQKIRGEYFPVEIEAVDRAVAALRTDPESPIFYRLLELYFLSWCTIETIAKRQDLSEFHVEGYLRQAIDKVARRLPSFDRRTAAIRGEHSAWRG